MKLSELNSIQSPDDFSFPPDFCDISHRGGTFGFKAEKVASLLDIPKELLPGNIGAYCNYLGGGLRGSIQVSTYSDKITGRKKALLDAFLQACKRVYEIIENEQSLNDTEYPDGETNWEAVGTNASRCAGIKSAY